MSHEELVDPQLIRKHTVRTVVGPLVFGLLLTLGLLLAVNSLLAATRTVHLADCVQSRDVAIMFITATIGLALLFSGATSFAGYRRLRQLVTVYESALSTQRRYEELKTISFQDPSTGLLNVRGLMAFGQQLMQLAVRDHRQVWCMFVDMDGLKVINDTLGHEYGTRAIYETASALKRATRSTDLVARLGGDEFVVLGQSAESPAALVVERLNSELARLNSEPNRPYRVDLSYGVVSEPVEGEGALDELLNRADKLMYKNKQEKRRLRVA